jgi:REP element-mobilizing transposase RayT
MPCYHFTLHAYRSWNADNPRGFVQTGRGIQTPNVALARYYNSAAKQQPVEFGPLHQQTILWIAWDACRNRGWRLHAVAFEPSHVHLVVSWTSSDLWKRVRGKLKNLISWALSQGFGSEGRRWLVRKGSRKRVKNRKHFVYLINKYLPRHKGLFWKEGDAEPVAPEWTLIIQKRGKPSASADG